MIIGPDTVQAANWLSVAANVAQVATGLVAVGFGLRAWWLAGARRRLLESYLWDQREADDGEKKSGLRSIPHLVARLGMTQEQITSAAFGNPHVQRYSIRNDDGTAGDLMLQWKAYPGSTKRPSKQPPIKPWS